MKNIVKSEVKETKTSDFTEDLLQRKANEIIAKAKHIKGLDEITNETSKETLQYYIALVTEQFERNKAVQITIFFVGLILTLIINAAFKIFENYLPLIVLGTILALYSASILIEKIYKNSVGESAKLREILIFLEKKY